MEIRVAVEKGSAQTIASRLKFYSSYYKVIDYQIVPIQNSAGYTMFIRYTL